jgi:GTPase
MEPKFHGKIEKAFRVEGRGTSVALDPRFEGIVKPGDTVTVPLRSGEVRKVKVKGVEFLDSWHPRRFWIALLMDSLDPQEIMIGGEVIGVDGD